MEVQSMRSGQELPPLKKTEAAPVQLRQASIPQGSADKGSREDVTHSLERSKEWSQDDLDRGIEAMNDLSVFRERSLAFEHHEKLNRTMVKIIDRETEEVVREIPPEKFLDMISSMLEFAGIIIDEKV
ncbi:flagellar protein FlaG [Alkalicoccus daliensis]|uniref:Flagellar protein FlaG n=1 Tax=Alkalicoccus daliensis TaxID=745820 RepID=A0A1H0JNV8_9BACI|nr:flagellar protein FlaG [Alkalicoccus daliensis]SDO45222.1 flagellar protein FlaG [Alkalicoccus daliensis]